MQWISLVITMGNHTTYATVRCPNSLQRTTYLSPLEVWSNFEIADMDFWRGEAYQKFFDYLESKGGFYYEVCCILSIKEVSNAVILAMGRRSCPLHRSSAFLT